MEQLINFRLDRLSRNCDFQSADWLDTQFSPKIVIQIKTTEASKQVILNAWPYLNLTAVNKFESSDTHFAWSYRQTLMRFIRNHSEQR